MTKTMIMIISCMSFFASVETAFATGKQAQIGGQVSIVASTYSGASPSFRGYFEKDFAPNISMEFGLGYMGQSFYRDIHGSAYGKYRFRNFTPELHPYALGGLSVHYTSFTGSQALQFLNLDFSGIGLSVDVGGGVAYKVAKQWGLNADLKFGLGYGGPMLSIGGHYRI